MGTQEAERDWVDVANELLCKCDLNLNLRKLTDCDAKVFVALYESILGDKVPDFIADPRSQEDDTHNVQSVIDSLSLDYLQISLSHITGENVVRGHKESIKNLLEIFDGLLEYLNEEISEESQNSEPNNSLNEDNQSEEKDPLLDRASLSSSAESGTQRSKDSPQSSNLGDVITHSEDMGQGASAHSHPSTQEDIKISEDLPSSCPHDAPVSEALPSAIPLQPPIQSNTPYPPDGEILPPDLHEGRGEEEDDQAAAKISQTTPGDGFKASPRCQSPALSERSSSGQQRTDTDKETLELTNGGPRKVLFRTQPDVLFLTLQDETGADESSLSDTEEEHNATYSRQPRQNRYSTRRNGPKRGEEDAEPLSQRRQRNKKTEEELHNISENLSHRIEELDQMLKRVLCEPGEASDVRDEGHRSPHSDSLEGHETSQQQSDETEAVVDSFFVNDGRQSNVTVPVQTKRGRPPHRPSQRKIRQYLLDKMYQEELERYEDKERAELDRARLRALEAEREYRETILKDASKTHQQSPTKLKSDHRSQRKTAPTSGRRPRDTPRKAPTLKVKENDLLPVLSEELAHLHVTPRVLGQMWEEQMQQVDRLHAMTSSRSQRHKNLSHQLEEARRRHKLLVEINRKEQEHNKRLRDFKERIQQQKSTQSKLREQRQQIARAKKYHNDYHVQHRARLMRARTKEERMFRQLFEEGLAIQKDRLREQRAYAREQRLEHQRRQGDYIKSMENYYKDQFSLLAEKLAQERQEIQVRKKAQEKALLKMKRELRCRMEREIRELQKIIIENDEDEYFQELDVQRLRNRVHLASFSYNTSYLP